MRVNPMNEAKGQQPHVAERKLLDSKPFSVSARVAMQLGRESISSSVTAILELVKNAYDADAELVRIRFKDLGTTNAMLVIEDFGKGMTVDDLRSNWMVIGTANKAKLRKTKKGRIQTGEKGLGRLGLDRLCERTKVQSIIEGAAEGIEMDVDWSRYEQSDFRLEEVVHQIFGVPHLRRDPISDGWVEFLHGTRLVLEKLKDEWNKDSLAELKAELSLLVSPFAAVNDFRIEIESGLNDPNIDGSVSVPPFVMDAAVWKVTATIDEHDMVEIHMGSARHDTEYRFKPEPWNEAVKGLGTKPFCGPVRFEFYFFPRKEATFGDQTLTTRDVSQFLVANQGIRIYRDGFRVKPYGQPNGEGDWLRLAYRKTLSPEGVAQDAKPGNWRLGYHQVIGAIFLTHEKNPALSDQTNREGLLEGKAFVHLRAFALKTVKFFEEKHQTFEMAKKAAVTKPDEAVEKAKAAADASDDALKNLASLITKLSKSPTGIPDASSVPVAELAQALTTTQQSLEKAKTTAEASAVAMATEKAHVERQKNMLSNLASLGILAASFGHESVDWAGNVVKLGGELKDDIMSKAWWMPEAERPELQKLLAMLISEARKLRKFAKFTLGNISREKRKKEPLCLHDAAKKVYAAFEEIIHIEKNIQVSIECLVKGECLIDGYLMDWESIFVNLFTNAAWALETTPPDKRHIRIKIFSDADSYVVQFDDSGRALEAGTEEAIFLPTFTTKRNARGEEDGTGLGLTIVKSFVEENSSGTITAKQRGELGGASFTIRVPRAKPTQKNI